jgi:hypothetical protein
MSSHAYGNCRKGPARSCKSLEVLQHSLVSYCVPVNGHFFFEVFVMTRKSKKSPSKLAHDSVLWVRLCFIIRVETGWNNDPISAQKIRKFCPDISLAELEIMLREMTICGRLSCSRFWDEAGWMTETYTYNE